MCNGYEATVKHAYCYLAIDTHFPVAWSCYRKQLIPADSVLDGRTISLRHYLLLYDYSKNRDRTNLDLEFILERERQLNFGHCISRLRGMYYFLNIEDAVAAKQQWKAKVFSTEQLVKVHFKEEVKCHKHDSNWITFYQQHEDALWANKYWDGIPMPDKEPIWEVILSERAIIEDPEREDAAYNFIKKTDSDVLWLLELSRLATQLGLSTGEIAFVTVFDEKNRIKFSPLICMRDVENPLLMQAFRHANFSDIAKEQFMTNKWKCPDLQKYTFSLTKDELLDVHVFIPG